MFYTILLSLIISLSFENLQASYWSSDRKRITIVGPENSLDFSAENPDLKEISFYFGFLRQKELSNTQHFYFNQTTDLSLSKNQNLEKITISNAATSIVHILQQSYLPKVIKLIDDTSSSHQWDYLAAFPNLLTLVVYTNRISWQHLACYTPHLETVEISDRLYDFTDEEINAISKLKELKKITFNFVVRSPAGSTYPSEAQEIESKMRSLFPNIEINYKLDYIHVADLCA